MLIHRLKITCSFDLLNGNRHHNIQCRNFHGCKRFDLNQRWSFFLCERIYIKNSKSLNKQFHYAIIHCTLVQGFFSKTSTKNTSDLFSSCYSTMQACTEKFLLGPYFYQIDSHSFTAGQLVQLYKISSGDVSYTKYTVVSLEMADKNSL